jgi:hypothetical protein
LIPLIIESDSVIQPPTNITTLLIIIVFLIVQLDILLIKLINYVLLVTIHVWLVLQTQHLIVPLVYLLIRELYKMEIAPVFLDTMIMEIIHYAQFVIINAWIVVQLLLNVLYVMQTIIECFILINVFVYLYISMME